MAAVCISLLAQDTARGWHAEAWLAPLLDRDGHTLNVVRGDGYLGWTETTVCCTTELGYALSVGSDFDGSATLEAMLQTPDGAVVQLNRPGVWAMVGGIDRGVLAYAAGREQADIRLLELKTRTRRRLPPGVNTNKIEYDPSISGRWLLFGRIRPSARGYLWEDTEVVLTDLKTGRSRVLSTGKNYRTYTYPGRWLLFGRVRPSARGYLWEDTEVVLTDLKTGRSRVLSTGKNYRTYTYPGQVNGDWLSYTACKFNKYGPNCGVTRYRISTGERSSADLDGSCCTHGDPHTQNYTGAPGSVASSGITSDGVVYMAMTSGQNTSWCRYSEVWAWDRQGRLAYMFGEKEDDYSDNNYDEPYAGLIVYSLYVDGTDPTSVVLSGHTTHEDHGYECDLETSALYAMGQGSPPPAPSPSPAPAETATPSPAPTETPASSPTPEPSPSPTPTPTPAPTPTPSPSPSCALPVCL